MNSNEIRRKRKIEKAIKACERVAVELKGTTLTDEEFTSLASKLNMLMKVVYQQRSQRSRAAAVAFNEAMHTLQVIKTKS